MKKWFLIACSLSMGLFFCSEGNVTKTSSDSSHSAVEIKKDTVEKTGTPHELTQFATDDCNQLLNRLFQGSSFKSAFPKNELIVSVDGVKDSTVSIQVSNKENNSPTAGWINLDLRKKEMADITNDPDAPVILKYQKDVLDSLLTGCTFRDTE